MAKFGTSSTMKAEGAPVDDRHLAGFLHARGGRARRAIHHGHEADRLVLAADLHHLVADHHLDDARLHDIETISRVAAIEDDVAGGEAKVRPGALGKAPHVEGLAVLLAVLL